MHETEKHKINLIYNHNFKQSLIFIVQGKNFKTKDYTKSFGKQASGKDNKVQDWQATLLPRKSLIQVLPILT